MQISPVTYNTLVYYSAMYGLQHNDKVLRNISNVIQSQKVRRDVMWDILCEARARLSNPKVKRFYEELKKEINYDEFRPTEV